MTQSGGFDGMSSEHQASAERSYARWAEDTLTRMARLGVQITDHGVVLGERFDPDVE